MDIIVPLPCRISTHQISILNLQDMIFCIVLILHINSVFFFNVLENSWRFLLGTTSAKADHVTFTLNIIVLFQPVPAD
jgi:hypothetical protein